MEQHGSEVVRVFSDPGFVVREHLFTPLQESGVVISYEVEVTLAVAIEVRFRPSLNLMWPSALGGQSIARGTRGAQPL